jgi:N-formylglutamate deformylase
VSPTFDAASVTPRAPAVSRTDTRELVARFESCALPPWAFGHREHLFVAWTYLRAAPFEEGAFRFVRGLKKFAAHHGATQKFHATITWTLLQLIAEAIHAEASIAEFDAFLAAHPELLDVRRVLSSLYDLETLDSDRARRVPLVAR